MILSSNVTVTDLRLVLLLLKDDCHHITLDTRTI
jgi:hypothetical protein